MNTPTPAELVGQLPPELSDVLHLSPTDQQLPATCITDRDWLAEQVRLRGQIWNIDDQHVLATLWWYSASTVLVTPSLASLAVTGHAFSPRLQDLVLHHTPSSRFHGSHSTAMIDSDLLAAELRTTLNTAIDAVAAFTKGRPAPLWAIATDAIANRLLWAGQAINRGDRATTLAAELAARIGRPLPPARYVDVGDCRFVHRTSCCLLYRVPGQTMCTSCPRRAPTDRLSRITATPAP